MLKGMSKRSAEKLVVYNSHTVVSNYPKQNISTKQGQFVEEKA
jgi:hypothetical protein